jgi:hypothetical protein
VTSHAKPSHHPHWAAFLNKVNDAARWAWADRHDDVVPATLFVLLQVALVFVLFVVIGLQ